MPTRQKATPVRARGFSLTEILIVGLILSVLLAVAVPSFFRARQNSRAEYVVSQLKLIEAAKLKFAAEQKLLPGNAVNDAVDLVPGYLPKWPTGPVPGAIFSAQAVGADPTMNGQTAASIELACTGPKATSDCPF